MTASLFNAETTDAIEKQIDDYFAQAIVHAGMVNPAYVALWQHLYELIKAGGKRFRPNMTLLSYQLFGGTDVASIMPIATAQELLHFGLLIHDDIIDRDYTRHGVSNIAGRYQVRYREYIKDDAEVIHFAHSAALLAGDLMLFGAHELIAQSSVDASQRQAAQAMLSQSMFDVVGGELLDSEVSILPYAAGDALKIALYKTARYSFVTPLITGATLAGANDEQKQTLRQYAEVLGIAYQLVDDLLSMFGVEQETGKPTLGDIREGKRTFMVEQAMNVMSTNDKFLFNQAFGNQQATTESIKQAKEILLSCGAKAKTEQAIAEYKAQAQQAVDALTVNAAAKTKLMQLITIVTERVV